MNEITATTDVLCPICKVRAAFAFPHPEGRIYRCPNCTLAFTDPASIHGMEKYDAEYFEVAHRNWFANQDLNLFDWIEKQIPGDAQSLIDVGCGQGQLLDFLRSRRPAMRLVGVDLAPNEPRNGIEFYRGDALDFDLGTFDVVTCLATIEHVSDASAFARQLSALCKPSGTVVVMTVDEGSLMYGTARLARNVGVPIAFNRLYSSHHLNHFTRRSLRKVLENNGLRVDRSLTHDAPTKQIDVPVENPFVRPLVIGAMVSLLSVGKLIRKSYLQTVVCTKPASGT